MQNNQRFGSDSPGNWKSRLYRLVLSGVEIQNPQEKRRAERLPEQLRALGIKLVGDEED